VTNQSFVSAQHEAYSWLRQQILYGSSPAGSQIRPGKVAEDLGISRMPVREALRQLEAEGLIVMRPNRAAVVMELSPAEAEELIEMRGTLEGIALRYAMPKLKGELLADLERLSERLDRARGEPQVWVERHAEFHGFIRTLSGKRHVTTVLERIQNQLQPSTYLYIKDKGVEEMDGHEHRVLMDIIRSGDVETAETLMRGHVRQFSVSLTRFLQEQLKAEAPSKRRRAVA
jgi:DNA-binding GntR family transcriptional regulator